MSVNQNEKIMSNILEILKMMAESGAEIYRIEESASKMFQVFGAVNVDVFAITSNITISVEMPDGSIKTHTRRIKNISSNIEKIHNLNSLVRNISEQKIELTEIENEIKKIKATPQYSNIINILFYGIIAGAFYLFFGGRNLAEFSISLSIGFITGILSLLFEKIEFNKILTKFICSFVSSFISVSLKRLNLLSEIDYIVISNIMTLIPGIGLTNSLRDLFVGDSISGALRLLESAMLALAIACGYIVTTFIFGGAL